MAEDADKHNAGEKRPAEDGHRDGSLPEAKLPASYEGETMSVQLPDTVVLTVTGNLEAEAGGAPIVGQDCVIIVDKKKK